MVQLISSNSIQFISWLWYDTFECLTTIATIHHQQQHYFHLIDFISDTCTPFINCWIAMIKTIIMMAMTRITKLFPDFRPTHWLQANYWILLNLSLNLNHINVQTYLVNHLTMDCAYFDYCAPPPYTVKHQSYWIVNGPTIWYDLQTSYVS